MSNFLFIAFFMLPTMLFAQRFSFPAEIEVPAKIEDFTYTKIAIGDIVGDRGSIDRCSKDVTDELTGALFETGKFEILDRQHIDQILKEHDLNQGGFVDDATAAELGRFIGSAALIFGRVQSVEYKQELKTLASYFNVENCPKRYKWVLTYKLQVNIKVVDVQTSKILLSTTLETYRVKESSSSCSVPAQLDPSPVYDICIDDIGRQTKNLFVPLYYTQNIKLEGNKAFKDELDKAVTMIKLGETKDGLEILNNIVNMPGLKDNVKHKAFYNLGTVQYFMGDYSKSANNLKQAVLLDSQNEDYLEMYNAAKAKLSDQ